MCAGASAARAANRNAKRQHRYSMWRRYHKGIQGYSRYKISKLQHKLQQHEITKGLYKSWDRAQLRLNRVKDRVWRENQKSTIAAIQKSQYAKLLAGGKAGKSIKRFGILEAAALGRQFAARTAALTDARQDFMTGTMYSREKAAAASTRAWAKTSFAPTPDIQAPAPVYQNVGMAFLGDILGAVGTAAGAAAAFGASDSRLKEDYKKIGESIDGHNIYNFKYIGDPRRFIGVMAEEVLVKNPEAVGRMDNGYWGVNYSKIDVEFREVAA